MNKSSNIFYVIVAVLLLAIGIFVYKLLNKDKATDPETKQQTPKFTLGEIVYSKSGFKLRDADDPKTSLGLTADADKFEIASEPFTATYGNVTDTFVTVVPSTLSRYFFKKYYNVSVSAFYTL